MVNDRNCKEPGGSRSAHAHRGKQGLWLSIASCASLALVLTSLAQNGQAPAPHTDTVVLPTPTNQPANANAQMAMRGSGGNEGNYEGASAQRHKEIVDESTELLALAVALKTDVDKTNKDLLSLTVIRKASEIEKLAHTVKEKMKLSGQKG